MIKTRKKKTDNQRTEARLDALHRDYIRKRAMNRVGGCERCHAPKRSYLDLQTAHCHGRGRHTVRWDVRNSAGVCGGCHRHIDAQISAKEEFFTKLLGEAEYDRLYVLAEMTTKQAPIDHKLIEIQLKTLLRELDGS